MRALMRLLADRDLFERRVLMPVCIAGIVVVPILVYWRVI